MKAGRVGCRHAVALGLALALALLGCTAVPTSLAQPGARRGNVVLPSLALSPASVALTSGQRVVFTARPAGGEAMLFSVDWVVQEGDAGGTVTGGDKRQSDGSFAVTYLAPAVGGGPFHLVASIREFPAARAMATIQLVPSSAPQTRP